MEAYRETSTSHIRSSLSQPRDFFCQLQRSVERGQPVASSSTTSKASIRKRCEGRSWRHQKRDAGEARLIARFRSDVPGAPAQRGRPANPNPRNDKALNNQGFAVQNMAEAQRFEPLSKVPSQKVEFSFSCSTSLSRRTLTKPGLSRKFQKSSKSAAKCMLQDPLGIISPAFLAHLLASTKAIVGHCP
jgi:hypothetical protein